MRAVVFDLFHTLVSLEVSQAPGRTTPEILGIDAEEWRDAWMSDPGDYALGRADVDVPLRRLARELNPAVTDAQVEEALATRHGRFRHALVHVEAETLAGLRALGRDGYALGLVSNCGRDEVAHWPESPLAPLFDTVVLSCDVGVVKPDPAIYRLAAWKLGVVPGECLFVGNGGSDELAGARRAGMTPVLLTRHLEVMGPGRIPGLARDAEFQVRTVSELGRVLAARA
ncbi:MAG: HAD family hydrolase [bacterium]